MTKGGDEGRPPLVLLPGTLCDERLWRYQTRYLDGVAAPRVYDISRDASIAAMAERVLAQAPVRFLLAGLSLGGIVAFEIMRRAPERVIALALLNTNPAQPDPAQVDVWREEIVLAQNGSFPDLVDERWIPSLLEAAGSRAGVLQVAIRAMAHSIGPDGFVRQTLAQLGRQDSWSVLPKIACPALVIGGREDSMCPPALHTAMAAAIPNAQLAIIEDCGHLSTLERPRTVAARLHAWVDGAGRPDAPAPRAILAEHHA